VIKPQGTYSTVEQHSWRVGCQLKDSFNLQKQCPNKQDLSKLSLFFCLPWGTLAVWRCPLRFPLKSKVTKIFNDINNWKFSEILRDVQIKIRRAL